MAKDETQNSAQARRVYRSHEVHKRRVGRTVPACETAAVPNDGSADVEAAGGDAVESASEAGKAVPTAEAARGNGGKTAPAAVAARGEAGKAVPGDGPGKGEAGLTASPGGKAVPGDGLGGGQDGAQAKTPHAEGASAVLADAADAVDEQGADWEEGAEAQGDEGSAAGKATKRKRRVVDPKRRAKRWSLVVVALLVVLAVTWASFFAWNRWGRYDDAADIQGEWFIDGTAASVVIDGQVIQLGENVSYSYEIDQQEKTIRFSFGSWEGRGRYRFSDDRQRLLIIDGEYSGARTLFDDLFTSFDAMASAGAQTGGAELQGDAETASEGASSAAGGEASMSSADSGAAAAGDAAATVGEGVSSTAAEGTAAATMVSNGSVSSDAAAAEGTASAASAGSASTTASGDATAQQSQGASSLGKGVSLFNRQADPEALKAKQAAEQAAIAQAEREAKAAAEAEAAEYEEYGYEDEYVDYGEYDESSEYVEEDGSAEYDEAEEEEQV